MKLKTDEIQNLLQQRGWSTVTFAHKVGVDYSYMYRVLRNQRGIGPRFLSGFMKLCERSGINFRNYVDLE